MDAAEEGDTSHLTELFVCAVKEHRINEIRILRDMQWQMVNSLAIMHRSLTELCNHQANRRDVPFIPSAVTIFWYDPRMVRGASRFLGTPPIDLGRLEEVRPGYPLV